MTDVSLTFQLQKSIHLRDARVTSGFFSTDLFFSNAAAEASLSLQLWGLC